MNTNKRLYKSDDAVFAGVCGGIAEYLELDPTLIRILAVFLVLAGFGIPVVAYIIAMIVIPKRSDDYPGYIDVEPSPAQTYGAPASQPTSAARDASASTSTVAADPDSSPVNPDASPHVAYSTAQATPPGRAYTTSNPEAYDAAPYADQPQETVKTNSGIRTGITLGIFLVGIGLLALLGTVLGISAWRFWPMLIIVFGFVVLCTPGAKGWSLARAGNGISIIAVGLALQLWTLGAVSLRAFWWTFVYLWPILLIVIGLAIIGSATKQSAFKLFGSLLFSVALLVGMWNFGQIGGQNVDINLPGGRIFSVTIPAPDFFPSDGFYILRSTVIPFDR